ncbi:MAG: hypothetical protein EBS89_11450 [Proteobacteria bacterium]|nr:hypothetical protein [Pseudomonadota bacterium]
MVVTLRRRRPRPPRRQPRPPPRHRPPPPRPRPPHRRRPLPRPRSRSSWRCGTTTRRSCARTSTSLRSRTPVSRWRGRRLVRPARNTGSA